MLILRFTFENHMSFRDEADLTLVRPDVRTTQPQDGSWIESTSRVAALYGSNASGKSTVIDALRYMQALVSHSATEWAKRKSIPTAAFALDDVSQKRPSTYMIDFVLDEVRYEYGFSLTRTQVEQEWLYSFPVGRKRVAFERGAGAGNLEAGRELGGGGPALRRATGKRELALSRGVLLKHPLLLRVQEAIVDKVSIARFGESDRESRLRSVIEDIADGSLALDDLRTMLRVADIGIIGAEVKEEEANPRVVKMLRAMLAAGRSTGTEGHRQGSDGEDAEEEADSLAAEDLGDERVEQIVAAVARSLMFMHRGIGEETYSLPSSAQSTGTLTWLSLAAPAIKTVREGGVLAVDELDASLHPLLAQVMIQMFRDPSINRSGAQLIFTTHDTYFMSSSSDSRLSPEEIWFVEKDERGVSDLFRLSDFPTRAEQNLSRRYLQGRYGAVPSVAPSFLEALIQGDHHEDDSELDQ